VIESIIQNCPEKLEFVVIYYDLTKEIQKVLLDHFKEKVESLEFIKLEEDISENVITAIKNANAAPHLSNINPYLRLFAPMLLSENEHHIIYLDCDIIVQDNILNILNGADLTKPICAVTDYNPAYKLKNLAVLEESEIPIIDPLILEAYWYRTYKELEMDQNASYFCTGIMIINLDYFRKHNITEKAFTFLYKNSEKIIMADQDILNHVLNGNYSILKPKWNTSALASGIMLGYTQDEMYKARNKPSIIHMGGKDKAWNYSCMSPYRNLYWKYRKSTPWSQRKFTDKTMKKVVKKYFFLLARLAIKPIKLVIRKRELNIIKLFQSILKGNIFFSETRIR
jgi:lipopolysaccharide biosynthesis glycosyltransferase